MFGLFSSSEPAKLKSIFICESAGLPMKAVNSVIAVKNEGLLDDRYQTKRGYWDPVEGCQVTVITLYELNRAQKQTSVNLDLGQHRRNLVLTSIHPKKIVNRTLQIGEAVFEYHKHRPPCGYLDQLVMKGTAKALGKNSGFCFRVVKGGNISVGDEMYILK